VTSRRLTIGLRYKDQDAWTGGVHYVRNLVSALGLLTAERRPKLVVIGASVAALDDLKAATGYPDLVRISRTRIGRAPARSFRAPWAKPEDEIDLILMGSPPGLEDRGVQWIPDFQEHRLPELFPPEELRARLAHNRDRLSKHRHVMVSSHDVAGDVERRYGDFANRVHVVPFATFIEGDLQKADIPALRAKYGLPERYFICNNQLWRHKNHAVILRALARLDPDEPPVVFTGREEDHRDPEHPARLRGLAAELGLGGRVRFLGFLPRADQLGLMAGAIAVVQPSFCEGWSTVIEDAKATGRHVLASDIAVHREQIDRSVDFFPAEDDQALAELLARYAAADPRPAAVDYGAARRAFAERLWAMIGDVDRDFRRRRVDRLVIAPKTRPPVAG
jgi:hypothetical protein